jgi:hypothetical protein
LRYDTQGDAENGEANLRCDGRHLVGWILVQIYINGNKQEVMEHGCQEGRPGRAQAMLRYLAAARTCPSHNGTADYLDTGCLINANVISCSWTLSPHLQCFATFLANRLCIECFTYTCLTLELKFVVVILSLNEDS